MINRLSLIGLAIAMALSLNANAQHHFLGHGAANQASAYPAIGGDLRTPISMPGRIWVGGKYADQGLGYTGSYVTIGTKTRMFEDFLDGRWLFEGRGHVSENGGFFGNFGIERIFTLVAADADLSLAGWYDYDDDQNHLPFGESFHSWGVTGKIKTRRWDLTANGYFPFSTTDTAIGDPSGANAFFENRIVIQAGIDSALEGFDVTLRMRPEQLAFVNGAIDIGGYGYESELVDSFGGGRARLMFQMLRGWIFNGEINYDDRFNLTGYVGLTWVWGGGGRGLEYAGVCADLVETPRNDHIVRFNQDVIYAIDPDTGRPYNVVHVNNTAGGFENGSFEAPFNTLAEAEAASVEDDIIFVDEGNGSTTGYDTGFVMKDGQQLLGDGFQHLIPIANGGRFGSFFELTNDQDGIRPRITNDGGPGVTLASRNTVRSFIIDGNQSPGVMSHGIFGSFGTINTDALIEDNRIIGAALDGVGVINLAGDWSFARNEIENNGFSGIRLELACDPTSVFTFTDNVASNNGLDGIQIKDYIARDIIMTGNVTQSNGRDGVRLEGFKGDPLTGVDILFDRHVSRFNSGNGINIIGGAGSITITDSIIGDEQDPISTIVIPGGNLASGIRIQDFTTPGANDQILIENNNINGNGLGLGAGIDLILNEGTARALITGNMINGNGIGIRAIADDQDLANGTGTLFDVNVIDNVSVGSGLFGGNVTDGMRYIVNGGATMNLLVEQTDGAFLLDMTGNGANGISLLVGDDSAGLISNLNAEIRDVNINGSGGSAVFGNVAEDGQMTLLFENSIAANSTGSGFDFDLDTNENLAINSIAIQNVIATGNNANGFNLSTGPGTFTDVAVRNTNFANSTGTNMVISAIGDNDMGNPQIDNRTRLFLEGNNLNGSLTGSGLDIDAGGDASLLATVSGNTMNGNLIDGWSVNSAQAATINLRASNNQMTGNLGNGFSAATAGTSEINAVLIGNIFNGNVGTDFAATNGAASTMCLALSNNLIGTSALANANAPGAFIIELDGLTNGPGFVVPAGITEGDFGDTCEPAVSLEEAAFIADGFPPSPPPFLN